jgi:hypothetical protein
MIFLPDETTNNISSQKHIDALLVQICPLPIALFM